MAGLFRTYRAGARWPRIPWFGAENRRRSIMTIDFEASCLPKHGRSFPIEVGVSDLAGTSRSWLIRPHDRWRDWGWTEEAQAMHGLTRDRLEAEGEPPQDVLTELSVAVRGRQVVADSDLDIEWLKTLAAAVHRPLSFKIDHVAVLLDAWNVSAERAADAMRAADRLTTVRHRAGPDARWLALVLKALQPADAAAQPPK
jgi:hypothetical protein